MTNNDRAPPPIFQSSASFAPDRLGGGVAAAVAPLPPPRFANNNYNSVPSFPRPMMPMMNPYSSMGYGGGFYNGPQTLGIGGGSDRFSSYYQDTFGRIEGVVATVNSISYMFESSYYAVYSCFRAMISLAEHVSGVKQQTKDGLQAVVRFLRRLYRRALQFLRLRSPNINFENEFLTGDGSMIKPNDERRRRNRSGGFITLVYFVAVLAVPVLISRLMQHMADIDRSGGEDGGLPSWFSEALPWREALFFFDARSSDELSFSAGQRIYFAPTEKQNQIRNGWVLACDGSKQGFVPMNYFQTSAPPPLPQSQDVG